MSCFSSPLDFHPRILGLTGTHDQLHEVTKAYRVYHSPSPKDEDGDYLVSKALILNGIPRAKNGKPIKIFLF